MNGVYLTSIIVFATLIIGVRYYFITVIYPKIMNEAIEKKYNKLIEEKKVK